MKASSEPNLLVAFHNRPNFFLIGVSHKCFRFTESFKPSSLVGSKFVEMVFDWLIKHFKIVVSFHAGILRRWFSKVPGVFSSALGIQINSSRNPDYKGIEIKSGRSSILPSKENRATLFACVPDWDLSSLKSSRAILENFGYARGSDFKLYCTVTTQRANSQGLQFEVKEADRWLREFYAHEPVRDICIWRLDKLHERLAAKHRETFWVKAKSIQRGGNEWFQLESVTHTARPSLNQFDRLLTDGTVTMDHLIKRKAAGRVSEKGPLFKIDRPRLGELFLGEPRNYSLLS